MKFTFKELQQIEQTVNKLDTIARILCASDSTTVADVRALGYIIQEMRTAAGLMADQDIQLKQGGVQRALNLFANI
jgi:hypothetical protein